MSIRRVKKLKDIDLDRGIGKNSIVIWKRKYYDMSSQEVVRLRQFEDENTRLKKPVADLSLDNMAQKEIIKKVLRPGVKREPSTI